MVLDLEHPIVVGSDDKLAKASGEFVEHPYDFDIQTIDVAALSGLILVLCFHDLICPYIIFTTLSMSIRLRLAYTTNIRTNGEMAGALEIYNADIQKGGLTLCLHGTLEGSLDLCKKTEIEQIVFLTLLKLEFELENKAFNEFTYYKLPFEKTNV